MATIAVSREVTGRVLTYYVHKCGGLRCTVPRVSDDKILQIKEFKLTDAPDFGAFLRRIPNEITCECGELLVRSY
ncbi:hypothetical protein HYV64_04785 [Candidatus Shapirobacteria bacterium]|nr:hypothetical protein [Candidatus Shapirobacteria bacterium]